MKKLFILWFLVTVFLFVQFGYLVAVEPLHVGVFEAIEQRDDIEIGRQYFDSFGYRYTGGHYENELIPFRLHSPYPPHGTQEKYKELKALIVTKYPLIVFFHGRNNFGGNYHQLRCLRGVQFDDTFFLLAASCNDRHSFWGTLETEPDKRAECPAAVCFAIIHQLVKEFPVDKNEIHLIGYSDGTNAVSYMVQEGLKPKSAVYLGNEPPKDWTVYFDENKKYRRPETSVYFFYGKDDPTFPHAPINTFFNYVDNSGATAFLFRLGKPYNGHDVYKYVFGEYELIQKLIKKNSK
jgi:predicted peptidase